MRIDQLFVKNFKGFEEREFSFAPNFNLIVGTNGVGKTSTLDALAVAVGSWFLGLRGCDTRHIRTDEVRLGAHDLDGEIRFEQQFPTIVRACGEVGGKYISWERSLESPLGRTRFQNASNIKLIAAAADGYVRTNDECTLPLISYYGTGRLWQEPRAASRVDSPEKLIRQRKLSRLEGYKNSVDPRLSIRDLVQWIAKQSWVGYQKGKESAVFSAVKMAIISCVDDAHNLYFDANRGEVVIVMGEHGAQPFANLSDGQRCMLALVGDIAQKAAKLNPHLAENVLSETPGVVLIDELDLHLHPKWQRRVVEDLRSTFPKIQFICTSHSPFLIQSLRSGSELVLLDGEAAADVANLPLEDIARGLMGIDKPEVSQRYEDMVDVARSYLEDIERAQISPSDKLSQFKEALAKRIAPYADNPAFQAFLEMKAAAKFGGQ